MNSAEARGTPPASSLVLLAVIAILGICLEQSDGHYKTTVIPWVIFSWGLVMAMLVRPWRASAPLLPARPLALWGTLAWAITQLVVLVSARQTSDGHRLEGRSQLAYVTLLCGAIAGVLALGVRRWPERVQRMQFGIIVGIHAVCGLLVLAMAVDPQIDVWTVEMDAAKALVSGVNPFAITFPDPYQGQSLFFPPGVSVDGRLNFGFVYPPLSLLLCLPGYAFGDTRYATLAAMTVAAWLIGHAIPDPKRRTFGLLAALVFLFTPRTFFVAHRAWTDTFVVMLTALVAYCASRKPSWLFVAAGLYCCVKQHMFIAAPALVLLLPRPWSVRRIVVFFAKAGAVALAVTLPFVLWNVPAFINSVLNIREMFRTDSLSLLAYVANSGGPHLSKWSGIGVALVTCALGVWRAPRNASGFALVAACTHFSLYLFSTHAFCNEYYNVIGSLCVAFACFESTSSSTIKNALRTTSVTTPSGSSK